MEQTDANHLGRTTSKPLRRSLLVVGILFRMAVFWGVDSQTFSLQPEVAFPCVSSEFSYASFKEASFLLDVLELRKSRGLQEGSRKAESLIPFEDDVELSLLSEDCGYQKEISPTKSRAENLLYLSPYYGRKFRAAPLLLLVLHAGGVLHNAYAVLAVVMSVEVLVCLLITSMMDIWRNSQHHSYKALLEKKLELHPEVENPTTTTSKTTTNENTKESDDLLSSTNMVIALYFLNPISVVSSATLSLHSLKHVTALCSLISAYKARRSTSWGIGCIVSLSLHHYVFPGYGLLLLCPCAVILASETQDIAQLLLPLCKRDGKLFLRSVICLLCGVICASGIIHLFSVLWLHSYFTGVPLLAIFKNYAVPSILDVVVFEDYKPTLSTYWYVMQLMFTRYHTLYSSVLLMASFMCIIPIGVKFYRLPAILASSTIVISFIVQNHPTVVDFIFATCMLVAHGKITERTFFFLFFVIGAAAFSFFTVNIYLWIRRNTGNANFVFFQSVGIFVPFLLFFHDWLSATCYIYFGEHDPTYMKGYPVESATEMSTHHKNE